MRQQNEIAEYKMKEKKTKNEVAYNDKLDSRTSCCLAGGYLTSYRATKALSQLCLQKIKGHLLYVMAVYAMELFGDLLRYINNDIL